jgi:ribitol-5-phosphate 2-dehydrogenase
MDIKRIEMVLREITASADTVLIKPDHMAICAADKRYYLGRRRKEILDAKLPMALIHEAVGTVLYDYGKRFKPGDSVVLVPLEIERKDSGVKGNYREDSKFASSDCDGFMRDIVALPHDRLVPVERQNASAYVFSEILSVALSAVETFEKLCDTRKDGFGIWGDGSMGYVMGLALRYRYPEAKIYQFGKTARKLQKFSFATATCYIDRIPEGLRLDHCFECVGGTGSETAVEQILDIVSPQGCVSLLGVSEERIEINTRKVLEKGLRLVGNSRSDYGDIKKAADLIRDNDFFRRYLRMMISDILPVMSESDIHKAFEQDVLNDFKTVIKWEL